MSAHLEKDKTADDEAEKTGGLAAILKDAKDYLHQLQRGPPVATKTTFLDGERVVATDYAVNWIGLSEATEDSTHEITFNQKEPNPEFLWVSGMMDDQIAKISLSDPTQQKFFRFAKGTQPHTLRFDDNGDLWVGLEYAGLLVKLKKFEHLGGDDDVMELNDSHFATKLDVRMQGNPSIPTPINTHPHAFCFDPDKVHIWFTGKLTNTVGRVNINSGDVEHFALPTLGAVPIYLAVGPDNNVWGTCLANNHIFRVTTTGPVIVTEIPITKHHSNRRPIAIKPDPRGAKYMWFSNEAGHSVCRVDCDAVEKYVKQELEKGNKVKAGCTCSHIFFSASSVQSAVTEYFIPRPQNNMLFAGLAFDEDHNLWLQSYVDASHPEPKGPDFIIRAGKSLLDAKAEDGKANMTNVPIDYFELPTKETILHRIIKGPDGNPWFTELGADRIGTVSVTKISPKS